MKPNYKKTLRTLLIMSLDVLLIIASGGLSLLARFGVSFQTVPQEQIDLLFRFLSVQIPVTLAVFMVRKMYHYVWRIVSALDVAEMGSSVILAYGISLILGRLAGIRLPISIAFIHLMCHMLALISIRCLLRLYNEMLRTLNRRSEARIMLIGAGEAGRMLLHELAHSNRVQGQVRCIIDDNPNKWGKYMNGVPILGGRDRIEELVRKENITQIIFAIPTAPPAERRDILNRCQLTGCRVKTLPGLYQLVNGEVRLSDIKDIQVEDLLGRNPVQLDTGALNRFLKDKVVLVTGGGGSIGSELCRQISKYQPKQLIVLDVYENGVYDLQQELRIQAPELNLRVEIASIRDKERIYSLFNRLHPQVVFHAAAHKHVPLMEHCPSEAIKNNVFGTYHVVRAAEKFGVEKFVMISTDKAVNPTNFMGATKRFCEMILQSSGGGTTEFCAVRFGNVLGSNGSVVPLFRRQIAAGGPITLTDKRIIRYFMTIPEAAQLVMEAGAMAKQGQIFVLDMGEPVKILTLAENLIRMSGLEPYKDIEIKEIGLRPGEKLYEELLTDNDNLVRTANEKIFVEQSTPITRARIMTSLKHLDLAVTNEIPNEELIALMKRLVPTYRDPDEVNSQAIPFSVEEHTEEASLEDLSHLQTVGG